MQRRQFLQIAAAGAGAWAAGCGRARATAGKRSVATFCELCFWKCGAVATVEDGRVVKLDGNPADPLSNGRLCPRGNGGTGALYDPDRLKTPLIRIGERGSERFREASWEEALDLVARA